MRIRIVLVLLIGISSSAPSVAWPQGSCPVAKYTRADATLESAGRSWRSLQLHQESYGGCDDGALAEGYSEAVVTLLARHWDQIDTLVALTGQRPAFGRWAIRHIDATASDEDLRKIVRKATNCSGDMRMKRLCSRVYEAATAALSER